MARSRHQRGLTLIELTVALGIVAVLFGAAVMSIGAITGSKARAAAGELGGVIRSLYDTAALSGKTCRLVFQLASEKDEDGVTKYWAECAAGNITTGRDREEELRSETRRAEDDERRGSRGGSGSSDRSAALTDGPSLQDLLAQEKERVDAAARYSKYTAPEINPRALPSSVHLSVWTRHQHDAVKSGLAYLYFFPQGYTEKAHVYVRQGNNVWTLTVAPLTGKTTVVSEELEIPKS